MKFLGFSFYKRKGEVLIRVANRSRERFREKLRRLTKRTRSGKLGDIIQEINQYTMGWMRILLAGEYAERVWNWTNGLDEG